jgi:chemotaxis protein CheD
MPSPSLSAFGFNQRLVVGMAEIVVANNPALTLATFSLGSCLGVSIYDPVTRVGGMLHAMLPDSSISPEKAETQPGMFLDTGFPRLVDSARQLRLDRQRAVICVAGGAQIMDAQGYFNIGRRNREALAAILSRANLRVAAEEVGGTVNRTLYLHLSTGEVRIKSSGQAGEIVLWRP